MFSLGRGRDKVWAGTLIGIMGVNVCPCRDTKAPPGLSGEVVAIEVAIATTYYQLLPSKANL
jgi:hypothetical protein